VPDFLISALEFALGFTNLLGVWLGIRIWEASAGNPLPVDIRWSLYFGAFAGTSFWNWRKERLRARAGAASLARKVAPAPVRKLVPNAESLLQRYGHTGTSAERLLIPYLDRWIRISGTFEGSAESLIGDATFLSLLLEDGRRIQLRFPGGDRNALRLLRKGQTIAAACQVRHGYGAGVFVLDNCELTRAEPVQPVLRYVS
jgi:hypothetical protein